MLQLSSRRVAVLSIIPVVMIAALIAVGPIAQDQAYHRFADSRTQCGLANLWNVATNLPFLLVGGYGLLMLKRRRLDGLLAQLRTAYAVLFCGLFLLGPASAWYHLDPDDTTLLWDRLAIALVFMSLFAAIVGEHVDVRLARRSLPLLLLAGTSSLLWWRASGDLRLYVLVQFLPLLLVPLILLLFASPLPERRLLWAMLGCYGIAKLLEMLDEPIFDAIGFSGHSLKHLAAATGAWLIALRVRRCSHPRPERAVLSQ